MGMRWDLENQLSSAQAFTGAATVSTNSYQKASASQDLSIGRRIAILIIPTVAAGAGSSHLFEAIQADDAALTSNVTVMSSVTVLAAALTVGAQIELPIPQGVMTQLYFGLRSTITGGTTTVTVDAYVVPQDENNYYKSFPKSVDAGV